MSAKGRKKSASLERDGRRLIAENIRALRHEQSLTQEQAAHLLGMPIRDFQKIEAAERNITLKVVSRLGVAFDVPLARLFQE